MKTIQLVKDLFLLTVLVFLVTAGSATAQASLKWWNPESAVFRVTEGQGWDAASLGAYERLPRKSEEKVPKAVWNLARHSAGLSIRFRASTDEIVVRYQTHNKTPGMPHMQATGVSGVDLYAINSDGDQLWCAGKYAFGDTIVYTFKGLTPNDSHHKTGREYRLYLPLYNAVKWLEIGVPGEAGFSPLSPRSDLPIVVYGTSIAHGACASRPGMAWTSILSRKMDRPLINLGFSGSGKMEKEVVDLLPELDAKVYLLDCLPNMTRREEMSREEVFRRIVYAVETLRSRRPQTPVVLASHAGYTDGLTNSTRKNIYVEMNQILKEAYLHLIRKGIKQVSFIPMEDFGADIETTVDGTHPSDLGMMRYAEGYEKHLRHILNEPVGILYTTRPRTQLREPYNYDWEARHTAVLQQIKADPPRTVVIGNSITNFWGGLPKSPKAVNEKAFGIAFGKEKVLNLGYGWDRVENVLWRVYHGELDGYQANNLLINIGTNNLHLNSDEEIIEGLRYIVNAARLRQPKARIILTGIYPRRKYEERVKVINQKIAFLSSGMGIEFSDPGIVFLNDDGTLNEGWFSDGLHPNEKGYDLLADQYRQLLKGR